MWEVLAHLFDADTRDGSRLPAETSGIRKPPKPPLRVGLAMQEGDVDRWRREALEKIHAKLSKALSWHWMKPQEDEGDQ
jgi:hypothetical protein